MLEGLKDEYPQNDLERGLRIWGPIRAPISRKSIKLWGRIEPEFVINLYSKLKLRPS